MASTLLLTVIPLALLALSLTSAAAPPPPLTADYYLKSCPKFDQIMQETTTNKQISSPTTAAATLRIFFHDCFVGGCDASVLITSTHFSKAERDADINLSLPGDGFDVIVRAKTALELSCPGVVSCSDILAVATRNLIVMMGGPYYAVKLGRKDSLVSKANYVEGNLPRPTMSMDEIIKIFRSRKFTIQEMVALSGSHTIGFSHCKEFSSLIYNYSKTAEFDPSYNYNFAKSLRSACADYQKNPTLSVFNDVITPNKFDNTYFKNVRQGLGLLSSDHGLSTDPRTRGYVELYSKDQNAFFNAFGRAMEKLSAYGVKTATGRNAEVRRRITGRNSELGSSVKK